MLHCRRADPEVPQYSRVHGVPTAPRVLGNQGHTGDLPIAVFTLEFSGPCMSLIFFLHSHSVLQKHSNHHVF